MNIIHRLSLQSLKQNKKRTVMTVIGIVLSTALICAVVGMVQSGVKSLINYEKAIGGDFHIYYENIDRSEMDYVTQNVHVSKYYLSQPVGYALLPDSQNEYKPYYYVMEMMPDTLKSSSLRLLEGRLPEKNGEVVVTESLIYNGGVNVKVGDTLTLDVGDRVTDDGYHLTQSNPYLDLEEEEDRVPEHLENLQTHTYTVVGIVQRPAYYLESYGSPGYSVIGYMDKASSNRINLAVTFDKPRDFAAFDQQISETLKSSEWQSTVNTSLLEMEGALRQGTLEVLYTLAAIVLVIIVGTSVFVIRNSFAMSVSEKVRMYGMIASVGATSRQIRRSVLFEGLLIGLIGIPLGILCGVLAVVILIAVLNVLLKDITDGLIFVYSIPPMTFVFSIALGAATVFLSCLLPAIRAGRIPPIEAIRGNREIRISSKKLKVSGLTRRLFGIGGVIASKNLKRSRRKYRTTVISLVVSISIFLSLSSFIGYGRRSIGSIRQDYSYNLSVQCNSSEEAGLMIETAESVYKDLKEELSPESYAYYKYGSLGIPFELTAPEFKEYYNEEETPIKYAELCIVPEEIFKEMAEAEGITKDLEHTVLLYDDTWHFDESGARTLIHALNIKEGDTVPFHYEESDSEDEADQEKMNGSLVLTRRMSHTPMGLENIWSDSGYFFVSERYQTDAALKPDIISPLFLKLNKPNQAEARIMEIKDDHEDWPSLNIHNIEKDVSQNRRMILVIEIFLYGFITVITLIGVTNIFNTISTNMLLRRKEFAMLKSVGMTNKEFTNMIRLENILYSLKSLLIGIPLGIAGSLLLYTVAIGEIDVGYVFPWAGIGISIVFVFIIVGLTMMYSLRKIEEHSLVETIRADE